MATFSPTATRDARAVQAWQILISRAMNRQTITYLALSKLMFGKAAAGVLAQILARIVDHCEKNGLPALTAIVVRANVGQPGEEFPIPAGLTIDQAREAVYEHHWFDERPPTDRA